MVAPAPVVVRRQDPRRGRLLAERQVRRDPSAAVVVVAAPIQAGVRAPVDGVEATAVAESLLLTVVVSVPAEAARRGVVEPQRANVFGVRRGGTWMS